MFRYNNDFLRLGYFVWRAMENEQELGLGYFEGLNWRGFHYHATLSIAAYSFLVQERCLFSPQATLGHSKQSAALYT